jgi:4-amino-4-deoxy-L-arabinose transferase-like glycosyltransferase
MNPASRYPLFFKAFGDYKNPVYIYLLALVFKVTGPGILAARLQSAILGILTALLLGLLAHRVSRDETRHAGVVGLILMTDGIPHAVVV